MKKKLQYQTDWINSKPVYYNTKTKAVGLNMNDVVDWNNFEFDAEGLYNYLYFGYQIFEQTPVKNVKYLRHSSVIEQHVDETGVTQYTINELPDPIDAYRGKKTSVDEAVFIMREHVRTFEQESRIQQKNKRFLLPLSGGYDSRLLATLIEEKSRIDAFTYDISLSERYSFEVQRAKEVCRLLGVNWNMLLLNKYWNNYYRQRNFNVFCLEMPIHAAYHMEMYDKIREKHGEDYIVLSGSVGDWWSGQKVPLTVPKNFHNFDSLFFNHGISIPAEFIKVNTDHAIKREVYEKNIQRLKDDELFRIVFARRGRIGLASYIYRTAELYFEAYTPFYDLDVAMSQLNLPEERRKNRVWLRDFFLENNLGVEQNQNKKLVVSNDYGFDIKTAYYSLTRDDLLQEEYFEGIVDRKRVEWINRQLSRIKNIPFPTLVKMSQMLFGIDSFLWTMGVKTIFGQGLDYTYRRLFNTKDIFKAISEWTVLKPLEYAMRKAQTR